MQLISRRDAGLASSLVIGTFVLFNRPLQDLFELADSVENTYDVALVPALTVLAATLAFHQYKRRREIAEEARRSLARTEEAERLLRLGRALAESIDREAIRQSLVKLLPAFCGDRKYWVLRWEDQQWLEFVGDATADSFETAEPASERLTRANSIGLPSARTGLLIGDDVCFALAVGDRMIGVLGVSNQPALSPSESSALAAVGTFVALALRNLDVLDESRRRAIKDPLTGCVTRAYGLERLQGELRRGNRTGRPVSILLFDIDDFKLVNDTAGHLCGDMVLEGVGRAVQRVVRASDVCCRIGGDEFLIVLPDTPSEGAMRVAEKVREQIASLRLDHSGPQTVSVSVGYTTSEHGETDGLALVRRADGALYRAKREGRNRTCGAGSDTDEPAEHRVRVLATERAS
jgi:diguanylate cyclase (GGDEF)-like protein